jgi:hypothetical protein
MRLRPDGFRAAGTLSQIVGSNTTTNEEVHPAGKFARITLYNGHDREHSIRKQDFVAQVP